MPESIARRRRVTHPPAVYYTARAMPSPYDPDRVLNLRVTPELRARLDALVAELSAKAPPGARVTRHALAVDALTRGLDAIERELKRARK